MNSNVENLPPHVLRLVYKEVSALAADPPEGIKIYPSEEDITELHTSIEGPEGTPFAGGIFRMRLVLGKDFPAVPPKGYFLTKIFHPNVGHKGEICVNVLKRDWKAELGLRHVLLTIKCLLIHPNPESALNEEAGRLLLEDYAEYESRARLLTEIHAMGGPGGTSGAPQDPNDGPQPKKHAGDPMKRAGPSVAAVPAALGNGANGASTTSSNSNSSSNTNNVAGKKKADKKRALRRL
ncbi:ubiquitin-conjugating enzyme E2 S [Poecilia latipinna]|uniref:E2 ubiquitin-conjugating enzyme n=2 Tax=Poecilia TaxID=8080 RepID=A0A087XWF8_POEFO|nr:PREDICTED: ubiquitin-conjugating enzyme E2 S [Poecilia formosa]XP_008429780.1 PREDICTED: ubiquitin-conjugating enzyme E2 S [Poecilia reticulata]XP_014855188.1 PREDICTED: ubiquitin-conjugating enzyme E2 S [Poecilia mexicana]XP_014897851.1 PREDICTED: ubiquitin-conjugating enzyme E2 S [Poecilia latipinna]